MAFAGNTGRKRNVKTMRIFLAGAENHVGRRNPNLYVKDAFVSFFSYYKQVGRDLAVVKSRAKSIIVDSGAHSFFSMNKEIVHAAGVARRKKIDLNPDHYFLTYLDWLEKNKELYDYFVELDIAEIYGMDKLLAWRQEFKKRGLFKKCITVYHPEIMTFNDLKDLVEENKKDGDGYIALEGLRGKTRKVDYPACAKYLMEQKVRFHGFAMVKRKYMELIPFYSVDSSSWLAGIMYGGATGYRKGRLTHGIAGRSVQEETKLIESAAAYESLAGYFTRLWEHRGIDWNNFNFKT